MIFELLSKPFIAILRGLVSIMPSIEKIIIPPGGVEGIANIIQATAYLLPVDFVIVLLGISFALDFGLVVWRVALRAKSFVPFWGN